MTTTLQSAGRKAQSAEERAAELRLAAETVAFWHRQVKVRSHYAAKAAARNQLAAWRIELADLRAAEE